MEIISELIKRVKEFRQKMTDGTIISNIIKENDAYIIDMNVTNQLFEKGVNALGVSIADYQPYSPVTIQIKRLKGQPTNRVTLRDTGDFHESFFLEIGKDKFEIKANDWKTDSLIKKYGKDILGLTDENLEELIHEYIYPDLLAETKKYIYGK